MDAEAIDSLFLFMLNRKVKEGGVGQRRAMSRRQEKETHVQHLTFRHGDGAAMAVPSKPEKRLLLSVADQDDKS